MAFNGTVRVQINGVWTNLTYNSSTGAYEATITAPSITSFNQPGGVYTVTAEATNTAGTSATKTGSLTVKEVTKPVITITSPTPGAYVSNNKPEIVFTVTDEANGSGVNKSSVVVKVDGTAVAAANIAATAITNGFRFTAIPPTIADGPHTVTIDISDNDGNAAVQKTTTFTVDTVPPSLNLTSPAEGLITNKNTVVVSGKTNDATSSPVTLTVNGNAVSVGSDGTFSTTVTLANGTNTIVVKVTDKAGRQTTITRTVTLNTSTPNIKSITITPNPANVGASMVIKVVVE